MEYLKNIDDNKHAAMTSLACIYVPTKIHLDTFPFNYPNSTSHVKTILKCLF